MIIDFNIRVKGSSQYSETLTREQRRQARECMTGQFAELLRHSPRENIYWMETKTDLIELSHETFVAEAIVDEQGRPVAFDTIVERACAVLHVPKPANPYSMAFNARNRKGIRQTSFFSRYCWLKYSKKFTNPLDRMIKVI